MNTRKIEKTTNSRLFNKGALATAVATTMIGSAFATGGNNQFSLSSNGTVADGVSTYTIFSGNQTGGSLGTSNATTDYLLAANTTLTFASNNTLHYGNIDSDTTKHITDLAAGTATKPNVIVAGNLTMLGNVGSGNTTGNWTINTGNTLTIASNASSNTFNTANISIEQHGTLNLGNATNGYNRSSTDALTMQANITMASNSTINIGNGTTITGSIVGASTGQGTVNIVGNFTSGGSFGAVQALGADTILSELEQINISKGNTFTLNHNATATRMDINGTVTASGNITADVTMGASGVLNLNNSNTWGDNAAKVVGTIKSGGSGGTAQGTLNINGTFTTQGAIGQSGLGLSAINLSNSTRGFTTTFAHDVNATTIRLGTSNIQTNATLAISDGSGVITTVTGAIVYSGNSSAAGILDINNDAIFAGAIGTSDNSIETITIAALKEAAFKGSVYSGNITLESATNASGGNATLAFNGTANTAYTITGQIDGDSFGQGRIMVNTGNVTFSNVIGDSYDLSSITIADNAEMAISKNVSINNTMSVVGTLDVNAAVTLHTGGINIGENAETGSTLETSNTITLTSDTVNAAGDGANMAFNNATIRLNGATHQSHITSATAYIDIGTNNQTVTIQGNTTIDLDLANSVVKDGATIVIVGRGSETNSNGTLNISGNISFTGYQMFTLESNNSTVGAWSTGYGADESGKSLNATVTYRSSSAMGFTGNTKTVYDSAKTAIAADTTVFQALAGMTTDTALKNAIATMHPATGGAASASASISGSSMSTASTRMAYTRQVGLGKGMNAGSATLDESMWVQIFGADVDQDNVGGVSGYDADGQGLAIGIDGMSEDGTTRIGIAGSFANTDVSGKDSTTRTTTDIDTTQVMAYANKVNDDGSYLEGTASFAFNDNTGTRRILVGAVDRTASSAYDSTTFAVNVEAGWPQENDGTTITPTLGLAYSHLSADAYTETGAAGMNLNVTPSDYDTFEGKVGVKITGKSVDADGGIGRPEVRIGVTHNFGDDTADSTATFTAGGTSFTTTGVETDSTKVDLGLGYTYTTPEGDTDISVNIDGRSSSSYLQYGGGLTVKWKF